MEENVLFFSTFLGFFEKYHNTLCCPSKILHKHCFQFLLRLTIAPRKIEYNAYGNFGGTTKSIMVFLKKAYYKLNTKETTKCLTVRSWELNT